MAHYPMERRESVVCRMLTEEISISTLTRETGIAEATLYRWREAAKTNGEAVNTKKPFERHSAAPRFAIVVESARFNEAELFEYCRKKGLYPEQIKAWRQICKHAATGGAVSAKATDRKRIQALKRGLRRKANALAETAALLTLRKKAAAIWRKGKNA